MMLRLMVILVSLVVPTAGQALSITYLSVQQNLVGNASVDVQLTPTTGFGGGFRLEAVLPNAELFSSVQVVVDFLVESEHPVSFYSGATLHGRDLGGCMEYGGCDPVQNLTMALLQLSPEQQILYTIEPRCCGFGGDAASAANGLQPGVFRFVLDISQLQGMGPIGEGPDTRVSVDVAAVPEPASAILFAVGFVVAHRSRRT